jgi:hypothetical protein
MLSGTGISTYIATDAGVYRALVFEANGCASLSNSITITLGSGSGIATPVLMSESGNTVICGINAGVMIRLTTVYSDPNVVYQWYRNNIPITGATGTYYYATAAGEYKIFVTIGNCSAQSAVISVTYDGLGSMAAVDLQSENNKDIICAGNTILLSVNNTSDYSSGATYVWYENNTEITRGVGMDEYLVSSAGTYSVLVFEPNGCLAVSADTITISIVQPLQMNTIISSASLPLPYNTGTNLTATDVQGSIAPYQYVWYKRNPSVTTWTQISGTTNPLSTGNLTEPTWFKVIISSSSTSLSCNVVTDSIFLTVDQVELSIDILTPSFVACNTLSDSLTIRISNNGEADATNVKVEFNTDGTLPPPSVSDMILPRVRALSDTIIIIGFAENTGTVAQAGAFKAEITSCDQGDMNPATIYGSWKNSGWLGDPTQADEDIAEIMIYPNLKLTGKLFDTICSALTYNYVPDANLQGTTFTWTRDAVAGITQASTNGTGEINEILTNTSYLPITVQYRYILTGPNCFSTIEKILEVVVNPVSTLVMSHYPANGSAVVLGQPITVRAIVSMPYIIRYTFTDTEGTKATRINLGTETEFEDLIYRFNEGIINTVEIVAINEYGCESRGVETFVATYNLPNVITPNEDTNRKLLEGYNLKVYNRWGSELYRGMDGWDGKYKGSLVASGTYMYVLHYEQPDGKKVDIKRTVYVKY